MDTKAKILYAEDDATLGFITKDNLELNGYEVHHATDGKEALGMFEKSSYDLCILDVMMPEMDGYQLADQIRKANTQIPILFLTAKSLKEDRIKGLQIGADDYITKPFSIEELVLKIEVFLRRKFISNPDANLLNIGNYTFDHTNLSLTLEKESKSLTQKEGDLLKMLILHKNQILKRSQILKELWGEDDYFLGRSMDVFISRLRKYLKGDASLKIENVHGVGFRLLDK
jgi:DNA-binding response OmpR family regulator